MNKRIIGYRHMLGFTQAEIAKKIGVSEVTYRKKEKGSLPFKDYEMEKICELVRENVDSDISIMDIFFNY